MKALGYFKAHELKDFSIEELELPIPEIRNTDVLVRVKAISLNPVDYKVRGKRSSEGKQPVILGWDVAGVIEKIGSEVRDFNVGDEVFYAGELTRDGGYAEYQAVDHQLIALKPKKLSFTEAAAIPLTALTAWEALMEPQIEEYTATSKVLIIGGAGGVGSIAIQLLKAMTPATVLATASRPETVEWCRQMGADIILDHRNDLLQELKQNDIEAVDIILGTTHSDKYLKIIPQLLRPFGHFCLIDDPEHLDIVGFKSKCLRVHWEFMMAKTMLDYQRASQGMILGGVAQLIEEGRVKTTVNCVLKGLTRANLKTGHELLESGKSIGKIVIEVS